MAPLRDLSAVADRLRAILRACRGEFVVTRDTAEVFSLAIAGREDQPSGYVAGLRVGRRYVSCYLMPVYAWPDLLDDASPELRRRMQGKSCFNFTAVDEPLLAELRVLTIRGFERYRAGGWPVREGART